MSTATLGRWNAHRVDALTASGPPLVWSFAKQRYVRTPAGVRRYGAPIGSPIPIGRRNKSRRQTPNPNQAELDVERAMSDDDLYTAMTDALTREDMDSFGRFAKETDRREAETERLERRRETDRARRAEAREARDEQRAAAFEAAMEAGVDEEQAVEEIYGIPVERQRRQRAVAVLNSSGYKGHSFDQMLRKSFEDHVYERYIQAEEDTRGSLLNKRARQINARGDSRAYRGIDPLKLFTGPERVARAYASDELLAWWDVNGRPTLDEWRADLLGDGVSARNARAARGDFLR